MPTTLSAEPALTMADVPPAPPVRGRRSPKWIALGIVALCLGALGSFFLYNQLSQAQTVVAVAHTIYRGSVVQADDLTAVTVGNTPGISTVSSEQIEALVGQRAVADLVEGSLLTAGSIGPSIVPEPDRSVVGIRLVNGRAPVGYLPPSSLVSLVAIPPAGVDASYKDAFTGMIIKARIVDVTKAADGLSILVNVDVPARQSAAAAGLAARERLVITRESGN